MKNIKITKSKQSKNTDMLIEEYLPKERIFKALGNLTGKSVAIFGNNTGYYCADLSKLVGAAGKVYSIELNPEVVEQVTYKTKEYKNVINTLSSEKSIPIESNCVDLAITINSFHDLDDQELTLKELYRIMKPKGRFFIIEWSSEVSPPPGPPKDHRILKDDIILVCEDLGFKYPKYFEAGLYHYGLIFERIVLSV